MGKGWLNSADVDVSPAGEIATRILGAAAAHAPGTSASVGATSGPVLAANAARRSALLVNLSDAWVYLSLGGTAAMGTGIPLAPATFSGGNMTAPGGYVEIGPATSLPYIGAVNGISTGAGKALAVVEV